MIAALGPDADADHSQTPAACLRAAARTLEGLLAEHRVGREIAVDLLATDALMTLVFEYASEHAPEQIEGITSASTQLLAPMAAARV